MNGAVWVVSPAGADAPGARALRREGVYPQTVLLDGDTEYARVLSALWRASESFVLVEGDVVPWPGAVRALLDCPEPWCGHNYPIASGFNCGTLGCVKFGAALMRQWPSLWVRWEGTPWRQLDIAVFRAVAAATGMIDFHVHTPPVAHARERTD